MRSQALHTLRPARSALSIAAVCRAAACPYPAETRSPAPSFVRRPTSSPSPFFSSSRAASTTTPSYTSSTRSVIKPPYSSSPPSSSSSASPAARARTASTTTKTSAAGSASAAPGSAPPTFVDEDFLDAPLSTPAGGRNSDVGSAGRSKKVYSAQQLSTALTEQDEADEEAALDDDDGGDDGGGGGAIDWTSSFHGLSTMPFGPETAAMLMRPVVDEDVEMKPDGIIYLPEIKYRRILNQSFGPGGWGLAPRGKLVVGEKVVTREYALIVHGRFVAQARGENPYFGDDSIPTAAEGCKSNALMRCCKDLGIASELWDPRYIRKFKKEHCREVWVEHAINKKRRQIWTRKDTEPNYPYIIPKSKY